MGSRAKIGKKWQMDGFERQIFVDRRVQEKKLAKTFVDGWVWAKSFGRWMGGSAKTQIKLMYPPKYQVPLRGRALKVTFINSILNKQ